MPKTMDSYDVLLSVFDAAEQVIERHENGDIDIARNFEISTADSDAKMIAMHHAASAFLLSLSEYIASLSRAYDVPIRDANAEHRLSMQQLGVTPR